MTPIVDGLEAEFAEQIDVVRLDASRPEVIELQQVYGLQGHPAFVVLDASNSVTARYFGPQSEAELQAAITAVVE